MISINTNEIRLYEARLNQLNQKGLKIARNEAINDTAFKAKELARKKIEQDFTLRNNYTLKNSNNPVVKAYGNRTHAEFGTKLSTMAKQEEGYTQQPRGMFGTSTPTAAASNEVKGFASETDKRNKKVAPSLQRRKLKGKVVTKRYNNLPAKQRTMALVRESFKTGKKHIVLGRSSRSMYKVSGRKPQHGKPNKFRLDRIYHIQTKPKIHKANPWLEPSSMEAQQHTARFYRDRMHYQFMRAMGIGR